jgi:hypothetical protein
VLKGSFDAFAESNKGKKGTAEVDIAFLKEIEAWRELLARHMALRNPELTQRELNYAVQTIIDRIIFLRICEDRGIEPYGRLATLKNGTRTYPRLVEIFRDADDRYNSGLFHFRPEKDRPDLPDTFTPNLVLDDKPIKEILSQAVEVTKLSLLLKVLEGESRDTLSRQLTMFRERALPDLTGNIKCGNSLIGPDFYRQRQMGLFSEDERQHLNVFDWQAEFPEIMQAGGFDAVIGNPPYVRQEMLTELKDYFAEAYQVYHGAADLCA